MVELGSSYLSTTLEEDYHITILRNPNNFQSCAGLLCSRPTIVSLATKQRNSKIIRSLTYIRQAQCPSGVTTATTPQSSHAPRAAVQAAEIVVLAVVAGLTRHLGTARQALKTCHAQLAMVVVWGVLAGIAVAQETNPAHIVERAKLAYRSLDTGAFQKKVPPLESVFFA